MEIANQILSLFSDFTDPRKRVFVGYLALSALIALIWLIVVKRQGSGVAWGKLFDRNVFLSDSSKADAKIFVINQVVMAVISPLLLTQLAIATAIYMGLHRQGWIASGQLDDTPGWVVVPLFTIVMFTLDDFTKFLVHRWMHKWPALWSIHKVHHSAETMTPITVYRVHPLEGVLYALRATIAQGSGISAFVFLFGSTVSLYTVVGVNVLVFVFHVTGSNLRHSHISINYWPWLEHLLISPAQHQLHHSIAEEHYDKNFGATLAVWDWAFGSLYLSERKENLTFGLLPGEKASATNIWSIYARPFIEIGGQIAHAARRLNLRRRASDATPPPRAGRGEDRSDAPRTPPATPGDPRLRQ